MSKISDRLTKLGQIERTGFGFGAKSVSTKVPVILVGVEADDAKSAEGIDADFYVVNPGKNGAAQSEAIENAEMWGAAVSGGTGKEIVAAVDSGADFVVAVGEGAPGAVLRDEEIGKGIVVDGEISEDRSKAIDSGLFDFLILDGSLISLPLSLGSVLGLQEQLTKYSNHIFLKMNQIPDQETLELLRDVGISALIYEASATKNDDLANVRSTIDKIEPKKHKSNAGASLPQSNDTTAVNEHEENDHDFEDDDWE